MIGLRIKINGEHICEAGREDLKFLELPYMLLGI